MTSRARTATRTATKRRQQERGAERGQQDQQLARAPDAGRQHHATSQCTTGTRGPYRPGAGLRSDAPRRRRLRRPCESGRACAACARAASSRPSDGTPARRDERSAAAGLAREAADRRVEPERRDDLLVLFGLAGAGGVDQPAAGRHDGAPHGAASAPAARRASRDVTRRRAPADVGVAPQRARGPSTGASTSTQIEDGRERQRRRARSSVTIRAPIGACAGQVLAQQLQRAAAARPPRRAGRRARRRRPARASCRPARRRRRGRATAAARPHSSGTSCEASSCTTNSPCVASGVRSGFPQSTRSPSGANAVRLGLDARIDAAARRAPRAMCASVLARSVSARLRVVELDPRRGCVQTEPIDPALDQPARMRAGQAERIEARPRASHAAPSDGAAAGRSSRSRVRARLRSTALTKPAALVLPRRAASASPRRRTTADAARARGTAAGRG